jgi:CRISPR-associated protein Cas2
MSDYRINAYHVMWIFVFFDLPVVTKTQRKKATKFRISLEKDGFVMMQYSVYIRHCPSRENMEVHIKRVKSFIPEEGKVSILHVTGKQYGDIINFNGKVLKKVTDAPQQLELF